MKDYISYILTKRFKAFLLASTVILLLFLLKEFGNLESSFTVSTMDFIQNIAIAYMGVQTVSDAIKAGKGTVDKPNQ